MEVSECHCPQQDQDRGRKWRRRGSRDEEKQAVIVYVCVCVQTQTVKSETGRKIWEQHRLINLDIKNKPIGTNEQDHGEKKCPLLFF